MKWALVLSGGGAKGLAHEGVIRWLEEREYPKPSFVAGSSMGSIVGAMYAMGWTSARIREFLSDFDLRDQVENPAFRLPDIAIARLFQIGAALGAMTRKKAMDSGSRVEKTLEAIFGDRTFADLEIPFACNAVDLVSGREVVFSEGPLINAIRSSMSFPGVFAPVEKDGMQLADGGILNNLPCSLASRRGFGRMIAVDVSPFAEIMPEKLGTGMAVLTRSFDVAARTARAALATRPTVLVAIPSDRDTFDFSELETIAAKGYEACRAMADELEAFFRSPLSRLLRFGPGLPRKSPLRARLV